MPKEVVETVKTIKDVGEKQFRSFITDRIETQRVPWTSTIHLNRLPLFSYKPKPSKQKSNVVSLKEERSQVIHMMLSNQSGREINENVFSHENSAQPPSLSRNEEIYCSTKSEIIKCLEDEISPSSSTKPPADVIILDGAFIVQILKPSNATTFEEYANNIFIPHVMSWLTDACRIDIVWDRYKSDSLKNATRSKRGTGTRRRVQLSTKIPGNWQGFLRVNENKTELFSLLAEKIQSIPSEGKH